MRGLPYLVGLVLAFLLSSAHGVEQVAVQLIWKHQFEFAAFYAAKRQGYYRDAGLDVTIREGGPGIDAVKEVLDGRAEFAVGTSSLVLDRYAGRPVVALAMMMQHSPIGLLAKRTRGVASVLDLADKPIAVDAHDRDEIEAYLRSSGIAPQRIRFVEQTDWTLESLEAGREAAKAVYLSNEPFWIRGREHEFLVMTPRSAGIDLFGNLFFTSEAMLARHPATVKAFRAATLKGLAYALEHPEEIVDEIRADYNSQGKSREHLLFEAAQIRELTRTEIVEPGYMSPGRWRHVVEVYASQKKLPADFDLKGFLYETTPPPTPAWLVWGLTGALLALVAVLIAASRMRELNRVLQEEIGQHERAELALLESETKYRTLVDNVNAIILRMNPDGTVAYFNPYAERYFGYPADEILGRHVVGTIVPPCESSTGRDLAQMMANILADPVAFETNENENLTRDGRRVHVRWSNRAIYDSFRRFTGVLSIGTDISLQRQAEETLRMAKEAAESANLAKSQFLATMSHEIRTPMNGILGMAQLLLLPGMSEEERLEYARIILASGQTLLTILNDILDFSKVEAGKLELEAIPFEPAHLLAEIRTLFGESALQQHLQLTAEWLGPAAALYRGDTHRLRQMLSNLVGNAIKFTAQGEVRIEAHALADGSLEFSVTDTGIGIPPDKQALLFQPFSQLDGSTTRQYGGTGLGLSIVRSLAEQMGGSVGVESAAGQGSRFWFRVPLERMTNAAGLPASADAAPQSFAPVSNTERYSGQVLVVEDSPTNRQIVEAMLHRLGLRVVTVEDGAQAVDLVSGGGVCDLILMDIQMPRLDGHSAARQIRAWEAQNRRPRLPIVALTADVFEENRRLCLEAGMDDFIAKPVDINLLHAVLGRWLPRQQTVPPAA